MSGPTTAVLVIQPLAAMLAAAAIRAAENIRAGHERADALVDEHAASRSSNIAMQAEARARGTAAREQEVAAAEARMNQLAALAGKLGAGERVGATRPLAPRSADAAGLTAYLASLKAYADSVQDILLTEAARQKQDVGAAFQGIDIAAAVKSGDPQEAPSRHLLARIAHLGPVPEDIAKIARELDATRHGERQDLLAAELRRLIQAHIESIQKRCVEEATATIVQQSLKDLGYQVEDIGSTLFVEGGVVHFRKPGWGNYMVRMRIDPRASTANFNVVRAVEAGNKEKSVMDHLAEDRWCAEFPALLKALEIQGVSLNVTRRLQAGEVPVQLVDRANLPKFSDEDGGEQAAQPRAREMR